MVMEAVRKHGHKGEPGYEFLHPGKKSWLDEYPHLREKYAAMVATVQDVESDSGLTPGELELIVARSFGRAYERKGADAVSPILLMRAIGDNIRFEVAQKKVGDIPPAPEHVGETWHKLVYRRHLTGDLDDPGLRDNIDRGLQFLADRSHMFVRVPGSAIVDIVDAGRLLTQHDTGSSNGAYNPMMRRIVEIAMHGSDPEIDDPVVYGFLSANPLGKVNNPDGDDVAQYGDVDIKLRPHMRERTTFTLGDSLDNTGVHVAGRLGLIDMDGQIDEAQFQHQSIASIPSMAPTPLTAPTHLGGSSFRLANNSFLSVGETPPAIDHLGDPYVEAQYHGGVTLDDIEEIIVPASEADIAHMPEWAEHGIKVTVVNRDGKSVNFAAWEKAHDQWEERKNAWMAEIHPDVADGSPDWYFLTRTQFEKINPEPVLEDFDLTPSGEEFIWDEEKEDWVDNPTYVAKYRDDQLRDSHGRWAKEHRLLGAGLDAMFPDQALITTVPWPRMPPRFRGERPYDKDQIVEMLNSAPDTLEDVDPTDLYAMQGMVTRGGVKHYMDATDPGDLFSKTPSRLNARPTVFIRADGRRLILSGHHRFAAALLQGRTEKARVVRERSYRLASNDRTVVKHGHKGEPGYSLLHPGVHPTSTRARRRRSIDQTPEDQRDFAHLDWAPTMTRAEAESWAQDSAIKSPLTFVGRRSSIKRIEENGFHDPIAPSRKRSAGSVWGDGIYLGFADLDAEEDHYGSEYQSRYDEWNRRWQDEISEADAEYDEADRKINSVDAEGRLRGKAYSDAINSITDARQNRLDAWRAANPEPEPTLVLSDPSIEMYTRMKTDYGSTDYTAYDNAYDSWASKYKAFKEDLKAQGLAESERYDRQAQWEKENPAPKESDFSTPPEDINPRVVNVKANVHNPAVINVPPNGSHGLTAWGQIPGFDEAYLRVLDRQPSMAEHIAYKDYKSINAELAAQAVRSLGYDALVITQYPEVAPTRPVDQAVPGALAPIFTPDTLNGQGFDSGTGGPQVIIWDPRLLTVISDQPPRFAAEIHKSLVRKHGHKGEPGYELLHPRTRTGELQPALVGDRARLNTQQWMAERHFTAQSLYDNTAAILDRADPESTAYGTQWYANAHAVAVDLHETYPDVSIARACAVLAALSPRNKWRYPDDPRYRTHGNVADAYKMMDAIHRPMLIRITQPEADRAQKLYKVDVHDRVGQWVLSADLTPEEQAALDPRVVGLPDNVKKAFRVARGEDPDLVLGGSKVRSFYNNILFVDDSASATIDSHQVRAMIGRIDLPDQVYEEVAANPARYEFFADVVRQIAHDRNLPPHVVQAITWEQWRREHPEDVREAENPSNIATARDVMIGDILYPAPTKAKTPKKKKRVRG